MQHAYKFIAYSIMTIILLSSINGYALFDNIKNDDFISIESNSEAIINLKQGIADYSGDVKVKYGKSLLVADRVRIYQKSKEITRIIADGNSKPACLTLVDSNKLKPTLIGSSYNIDCDLVARNIKLQGDAEVKFQKNIIRSTIIHYNHQQQSINAQPTQLQKNDKNHKIETIIDVSNN